METAIIVNLIVIVMTDEKKEEEVSYRLFTDSKTRDFE